MVDRLSKARQLLAAQILKDFKGKITGDLEDYVVDENPENRYFVGKLLAREDDSNSAYSSDVSINAVGADFYI